MADEDRLSFSLQENILAALIYNNNEGAAIAALVTPGLFEGPYKDIADRVLDYRVKHRAAPGSSNVDVLFDHVLEHPGHRQYSAYQRILTVMADLGESVNAKYVLDRTREFIKRQTLKLAIEEAGMRYQQGGEGIADDVEAILQRATKTQVATADLGTRGSDKRRALSFLTREETDTIHLGIPELDRRDLCPTRREMLLFIAPRKRGKSWFCTHCAKQALMQGLRVADISLEMGEERRMQRYFQAFFSVAKRPEEYNQTLLQFDELRHVVGFKQETLKPTLDLRNPRIRAELEQRAYGKNDKWRRGARLDNLVVKSFPSGQLTYAKFVAYMDMLERVEGFVPDLLIVDYPDLMAIDNRNPRISIGRNFVDLRGFAGERNAALVCPTQSNRGGEDAKKVKGTHVAEDISKVATADMILTYNQTNAENSLGLARLFAVGARNDEDRYTILITQAYSVGQFVLESCFMREADYWKTLKKYAGEVVGGEIPEEFQEDD